MEIKITNGAYQKLRYFIQECPAEVSGFGKVREARKEIEYEVEDKYDNWGREIFGFNRRPEIIKEEQTILEIYDIEILPQTVSAAHATIDEATLAQFMFSKMQKGESVADYKVWWHSHADMEAFFSMTDTGTIDGSKDFPYLISIVGNKKMDFKMRLDIFKPLRLTLSEDDLDLKVGVSESAEVRRFCRQEIAQKVQIERWNTLPDFHTGRRSSKKKNKSRTGKVNRDGVWTP